MLKFIYEILIIFVMESNNDNSTRVLFINPQYTNVKENFFTKLSSLVKDDSKNINLFENSGICVEMPLRKLNISDSNRSNEVANHPFQDYPSQHVIKYIIREILLYFDTRTIIRNGCLFLSKELNKMLNVKLETRTLTHERDVHVNNSQSEVFTTIEMSNYLKEGETLFDVDFYIETKDQGWASADVSSSWVELKFIDLNNSDRTEVMPIVKNYKNKDYQEIHLIYSGFKNANCSEKILNWFKNKHCKVEVLARCQYPGWACYIRKVKVDFRVLVLN